MLAISDAQALQLAIAAVTALAAAVSALWWRSERAHERRHAWSAKLVQDLLQLLERRRVTDAEIAAALRGLAHDPENDETKEGTP